MIKTLLLMGALTLAPLNTEGDTTPPTQETTPTDPDDSNKEDTSTSEDKKDDSTTSDEEKKDETKNEIKEWLSKFFEPQQVAMIMTWITYIGTIIGLIAKCYSLAKQKTLTADNVKEAVLEKLGDKVDEAVANQLSSSIVSITKMIKNQNETLALLTKVMALSQENTPESRVAILDLISRLGVIDNSEIQEIKETINKQVEDTKVAEEKTNESVDTIIETYKVSDDNGTSI